MVTNQAMDYALLGLLFLAKNKQENVKIADIAAAERIPVTFLRKVFQKLRKAGIVDAQFGPHGGYQLAQPPEKLNLRAVFLAVHAHTEQCERMTASLKKHPSGGHIVKFMQTMHADLLSYLNTFTLNDLLKK